MNYLYELRKERNYSKEKVEKDLNLEVGSLDKYEKGEKDICQDDLHKYSQYYQVNCDYIFGFENACLYAMIQNMDMKIIFTREEYLKLNKDRIYFDQIVRYIDYNDIAAIMKYQSYVNCRSFDIKCIDWKYIDTEIDN